MTKTVKEIIANIDMEMQINNERKYFYSYELSDILQTYKKELAEKDKEIMELEENCLCKYCRELHIHIEPIEKDKNGCKFRHKLPSKDVK